jgi:hypothetical protein
MCYLFVICKPKDICLNIISVLVKNYVEEELFLWIFIKRF